MSIADKLNNIVETKGLIKQAIIDKGVQVSDSDNFRSYADKINSIKGGPDEYIPLSVDSNGILVKTGTEWNTSATDLSSTVLQYAFNGVSTLTSASLNNLTKVSGTRALNYAFAQCSNLSSLTFGPITEIGQNAMNAMCYACPNLTSINLSSLISIAGGGMSSAFEGCTNLKTVNLNNLTNLQGYSAMRSTFQGTGITSISLPKLSTLGDGNGLQDTFKNCTSLVSASLDGLVTISNGSYALGNTFEGCTSLTSLSIKNLKSITEDAYDYNLTCLCKNCTSLTSVDISGLETINGFGVLDSAFEGCTSLKSLSFTSLVNVGNSFTNTFRNCNGLHLYFPALVESSLEKEYYFGDMLGGATDCTVHFPASLQPILSTWTSVTNGFSGTNSTILFDL